VALSLAKKVKTKKEIEVKVPVAIAAVGAVVQWNFLRK